MDEKLTDLGIDHVYVEHGGGHTFIPEESLRFLSDHLLFHLELARLWEHVVSTTRTLGATVVGQPTLLEVTVVLEVPLEAGMSFPAMHLDLSAMGLSSDLPLGDDGHGRHTANRTIVPSRSGRHNLPIMVETTEGEQYPFLAISLDVYPEDAAYLYRDQMGSRWEAKASPAGILDLTGSDVVHEGSYAQAITLPSGYVQYTCTNPDGFSTFGYTNLQFWIHPGISSTEKAMLALKATEGIQYLKLGYLTWGSHCSRTSGRWCPSA